jgi:hypothetical protein
VPLKVTVHLFKGLPHHALITSGASVTAGPKPASTGAPKKNSKGKKTFFITLGNTERRFWDGLLEILFQQPEESSIPVKVIPLNWRTARETLENP